MESVLSNLGKGLQQRGHSVYTVHAGAQSMRCIGKEWEVYLHRLWTWNGIPRPIHLSKSLNSLQHLARILFRIRPDVVSCHFIDYRSAYFAVLKYMFGFKLIVTGHGSDVMFMNKSDPAAAFVFRAADHVTGVSQEVCSRVADVAPVQDKSTVIYNGIDWEFWASSSACHAKVPAIVHVGSLRRVKGQDVLLQSFKRVLRQVPECRLILIGEGDAEDELKRLAERLVIAEQVDFLGWQEPEAIRRVFRQSTVFAFPSRQEGMGIALLEAMAAGLPSVASSVGGIPEVVRGRDTTILVPPEDEVALADGLLAILQDEKRRRRLSKNARERAKCFRWTNALDRYEQLFLDA